MGHEKQTKKVRFAEDSTLDENSNASFRSKRLDLDNLDKDAFYSWLKKCPPKQVDVLLQSVFDNPKKCKELFPDSNPCVISREGF